MQHILPRTFLDRERIIHSLKTALACIIGFITAKLLHLPGTQWIVISILVVMCAQLNVGSMIQKSYMRFLGTLSGSIIAAATLAAFGVSTIASAISIAISGLLFSYLATSKARFNDSGTLGAVTVTIILFTPNSSVLVAGERFLEISVGILIAALVSQFVLPVHASAHLRRTQAKTLQQLREYYRITLATPTTPEIIEQYQELDEDIVKSLSTQRSLAKEAKREPLTNHFNYDYFEKILRCEKEIFRSLVCMRYACDMLPSGRDSLLQLPAVHDFHQAIDQSLSTLASGLAEKTIAPTIHIPSLQTCQAAVTTLCHDLNHEATVYMNGFLFCAELLVTQLAALVILLRQEPAFN